MYELCQNGMTVAVADDFNKILAEAARILGKIPSRRQVARMMYEMLPVGRGWLSIVRIAE
jgi:hypothetical protein